MTSVGLSNSFSTIPDNYILDTQRYIHSSMQWKFSVPCNISWSKLPPKIWYSRVNENTDITCVQIPALATLGDHWIFGRLPVSGTWQAFLNILNSLKKHRKMHTYSCILRRKSWTLWHAFWVFRWKPDPTDSVMQNNNTDVDTSCQFNLVKSFQLSEPLFSNVQNGILIFILYNHQED